MIASVRASFAGFSRTRKLACLAAAAAVISACCALIVAAGPGARASNRPAGQAALARNFSLAELGRPGQRVSLTAYAGRPVIVNFFASWCPPCQQETPLLARFAASEHGQVALIGIDSNDASAAALRFLHNANVGYPVGFDPFPASTTTSYGVYGLPQTFFLNAEHRIVLHLLGPVTMAELTRGVALMTGSRQERG